MNSLFKFPRRVRIHGGECGAVARALHHEVENFSLPAVKGKVSFTTIERKEMSRTTFFKRIALTAIASLGFGMISILPASAAVTAHTLTIDAASDAIETGETATAVLTHSFVNLGSDQDSVTIQAIVTSANAGTAGTLSFSISDSYTSIENTGASANSPNYSVIGKSSPLTQSDPDSSTSYLAAANESNVLADSFTVSGDTVGANKTIGTEATLDFIAPSLAGTYVVTIFTQKSDAGGALSSTSQPSVSWTITVTDVAATKATTASSATLRHGDASAAVGGFFGGTAEGTDSYTLRSYSTSTTTTTPGFTLFVKQKDGTSTNLAQESYTVTVTGEAWITNGTNGSGATKGAASAATTRPTSSTGVKWLRMATPVADSATMVRVWSTGTPGTATITVTTDGGVTIGTKTVTFHGKATTLAVTTTTKKVLQSGTGDAITSVFSVTATDAGGRNVTGLSPAIVSSNVSAITTGSCTDASSSLVQDGVYSCQVTPVVTSTSGMTATLRVRIPDPAVLTATATDGPFVSTTYDVTMGGAVSTLVLSTDKATYAPGEVMVVTATAKDSSGNTPYDGQSGPTLRANKALGGSAAGSTITMNAYYDGKSTSETRSTSVRVMTADKTLFAPAASGSFMISGLDGQTTPASVSVSATVTDDGATAAANAASDAAAEAIDAANAATDAANLAAEAADAATVAAEEARDAADAATAAVEELATQVATLMAALKAQITTLANTVAKIAKKVKA